MATYAVGDIQGCYKALLKLLKKVDFSPSRDQLLAAGDVINRGPDSLATLDYVMSLEHSFKMVLGNHDLHFLAVANKTKALKKKDTLDKLLDAKNAGQITTWLEQQPLFYAPENLPFVMVHAGIPPMWNLSQAENYANEVEAILNTPQKIDFFEHMYGNDPDQWDNNLTGNDRLRTITNYFTRMRFCDNKGKLELTTKTGPEIPPPGYQPWYTFRNEENTSKTILFGHWAALEGRINSLHAAALDTGCVWGGKLTMMHLETREKIAISCDC